MNNKYSSLIIAVSAIILSGCGGGSSPNAAEANNSTSPAFPIAGLWRSTWGSDPVNEYALHLSDSKKFTNYDYKGDEYAAQRSDGARNCYERAISHDIEIRTDLSGEPNGYYSISYNNPDGGPQITEIFTAVVVEGQLKMKWGESESGKVHTLDPIVGITPESFTYCE